MEKYITRDQMRVVMQNAPASVNKEELLNKYVQNGYKIEGFNDQPEPAKRTVMEKIAGFTGGEKIAQGLGQAIANPGIAKGIEETQKLQMDTQSKLIAKIKENRALGEDTTKLDKALSNLTMEIQNTGNSAGELMNQKGITGKQIAGDAIQLGATIASAGTYGKVATTGMQSGKLAVQGRASQALANVLPEALSSTVEKSALPSAISGLAGAKTFTEGAIQGVKSGAISGAGFGASTGASQALKADKSAEDIAKSTVGGALVGAGTGVILGGITGGVTGAINGKQIREVAKKESFVNDFVSPKMTTAVKEQALKDGRVTEQGLLTASKITPSRRDLQLAESVKDVVSPKNSVTKNLNLIDEKVSELNMGVKAYVKAKKVPFNSNQLKTQLNKGRDELNLVFASDSNAKKTYDALVKEFMKHVQSKDTAGLLDARQTFDNLPAVKKLLDSQGLGENVKKEVALTVRSMANKYVADLLPVGNKYRDTLLNEHKMIEVMQNVAEKSASAIGKNKLQVLTEKYPLMKWLVGGVATGIAGGAGIGVGNSIIGSTD